MASVAVTSAASTPEAAEASPTPPDHHTQVRISGGGLVTPLGCTANRTWEALIAGHSIYTHAEAAATLPGRLPRVCELAMLAATEAIAEAGWTAGDLRDDGTGLVVGTSKGPVECWLRPPARLYGDINNSTYVSAGGLRASGIAAVAEHLAAELGLGCGPRLTLSAACATGLHALIRAVLMLRGGEARRALVVSAESALHPLFTSCFGRLGVLAPPGQSARPFDNHRHGFCLSEAAAAVCLELDQPPTSSLLKDTITPRAAAPAVFVESMGMAADASHLTGSDPQGLTLTCLLRRVIGRRPIDLIHAHGTGTRANDEIELAAVESALGPQTHRPLLYSHKAALGHSQGPAGLIGIVINRLCHARGLVPGNIHTSSPLATRRVQIQQAAQEARICRSLTIASGFGGALAAVVLSGERSLT
jgi:3-oxoacyl-[acyl-carrier-protein] synthase II